jgi:hypothetical protein
MQKVLSTQDQIKQLDFLYLALIAGQLGMAILLLLFLEDNTVQTSNGVSGNGFLPLLIAFSSVMSIGMSFFIYNKRKEIGRQLKGTLEEKLAHYRTSFFVRASMIEGANLAVLLIYFFIERNYFYLLLFAVGISSFLLIRPTVDRIVEDYQLSASEQSELRNSLK